MASIDDLLGRADALPDPRAKTREDLVRDLEWSITHAENMAATMPKEAAYRIALHNVENIRRKLDAMLRDEPTRHLRLVTDDEAWEEFVDGHPELATLPIFTDDEVVEALRAAIANREQPWLQGAASSSCVLRQLRPNGYSKGLCQRLGKQLARLTREGRVVRLQKKWSKGRGGSIWTLDGLVVNGWWLKQYELEAATDADS